VDNAGNIGDPDSFTWHVDAPPTVTNDATNPLNVQYSDPIPVTVHATDSDSAGSSLTASATGLPSGVSLHAGTAGANSQSWTFTGQVLAAPGTTFNVTVKVADDLGAYSTTSFSFTVAQEDARSYYTGQSLFWTPSTSSTSATVTLTATVKDITAVSGDLANDPYAGDIRNATVSFVDRSTNTPLCSGLKPALVNSGDTTIGTVTCQVTLAAGSTSATQYTIGIVVGGYYTDNNQTEDSIIDVAQPLATNFITGGGYLVNPTNTAGTYAGDANQKTNFGFNVKYNKSGTNLQGHVNIIVRKGSRVYQFQTNALTTLGVQYWNSSTSLWGAAPGGTCTTTASAACPIQANFQAKANLYDVTGSTAVLLGGNLTLQMALTDHGEPGSTGPGPDTLGITVYDSSSKLLFSSQWNNTQTVQKLLDGGNLVAH
jgi:hypothetical protein